MKELDYKNLIKLVEKKEKGIKDYIEMINNTPILDDRFVYQVMNKEDKEEIRKKLKEIQNPAIVITFTTNKRTALVIIISLSDFNSL